VGVDMRGILYSIIAALLVIPVIGLILFNSQLIEKNVDVNIRSNELEYFSTSVEEDMARFLKIAGRRALISAVSNVITNGVPLTDAQANLSEMIMNGTLDGVVAPLIGDDNFNSWRENVTNIAASSGFDLDFQNYKVNITQNDSYNVLLELSTVLNISDANLDMGIEKNLTASIAVSIDGIEDPLFPLRTYSKVIKVIHISNFSKINFPPNLGNLTSDIEDDSYHSSSNGASFLDRLEGKEDLSSKYNCPEGCGLESFVNKQEFDGVDMPFVSGLSVLDYEYWNNVHGYLLNNTAQGYNPQVYSWFRISSTSSDDYGLDGWLNMTT
jgi:hypothetical protein